MWAYRGTKVHKLTTPIADDRVFLDSTENPQKTFRKASGAAVAQFILDMIARGEDDGPWKGLNHAVVAVVGVLPALLIDLGLKVTEFRDNKQQALSNETFFVCDLCAVEPVERGRVCAMWPLLCEQLSRQPNVVRGFSIISNLQVAQVRNACRAALLAEMQQLAPLVKEMVTPAVLRKLDEDEKKGRSKVMFEGTEYSVDRFKLGQRQIKQFKAETSGTLQGVMLQLLHQNGGDTMASKLSARINAFGLFQGYDRQTGMIRILARGHELRNSGDERIDQLMEAVRQWSIRLEQSADISQTVSRQHSYGHIESDLSLSAVPSPIQRTQTIQDGGHFPHYGSDGTELVDDPVCVCVSCLVQTVWIVV